MRSLVRAYPTETKLLAVLVALCTFLAVASDSFFTLANATSLLNNNAVNVIWAVGLLVVLIAGGIDISFAVAASVVQYLCVYVFVWLGGANWAIGFVVAGGLGICLGLVNAFLIHRFKIISIVVTIATFNAFFGLLMFFSSGKFLYNLPDWWSGRLIVWEHQSADGTWAELTLPVPIMLACMLATFLLIRRTNIGRQLFAFGDNPEGARRVGVNVAAMQAIAFGWMGLMAGIGGLMQAHIVKEVVPNALYGRELDVLAAVVLGGARLGGGRGSVIGCFLGVALVAVTQNGLNLLGVSPYAFKMVIGLVILVAISTSNLDLGALVTAKREGR
ncbi:ABC transporter permease [Oharaeibacter diazotrophicus]|uniref:Monosaccharide ABC transporter membrane protein (CUT2 family) n=1 Tax=Oharaeibacter diazotrophicus TaxID=1920512 RepID=A0A4R6RNQ0_9HYPH|nr:ABC transporter permease [Oharaeibacter diazotrophicus]TDP87805.1 monosaccharide ABC transporter membrane protein (CUT2 family) [Oharaeibacter diazotrophicus]BBE74613.1 ribose transport system permease protein RbsC [Pleomorphomonas sp. SM30]GLS76988.1 ABC transporter permease [Oharaeibacter diazotrophicus]